MVISCISRWLEKERFLNCIGKSHQHLCPRISVWVASHAAALTHASSIHTYGWHVRTYICPRAYISGYIYTVPRSPLSLSLLLYHVLVQIQARFRVACLASSYIASWRGLAPGMHYSRSSHKSLSPTFPPRLAPFPPRRFANACVAPCKPAGSTGLSMTTRTLFRPTNAALPSFSTYIYSCREKEKYRGRGIERRDGRASSLLHDRRLN